MTACQRAGCSGHYDADGYCDECGRKAPASAVPSPRSAPSGPVPTTSAALSGSTAFSGGTAGHGTGTSGRSGSRRGGLGAGLVAVPPVPVRDPTSAVLADPVVPESHRVCGQCGEPVGRGKDGKPGRVRGFCPKDRTPFSFEPGLRPGDLVDDRYEILGALAHGGLGWIYLGRDRNISHAGSDRWVVLKGLINTGDPDALAAAVAERRFLVEVDHPGIVKIHDFAEHPDPITGATVGYIVMEYVGGRSLKDIALNHRDPSGARAPLPLAQVLAYGLEVLPALGYLHDRGLLFCDFKPDNVIHVEDHLKIIDLGAVRRVGDQESALYGTPGYQAPELATAGPSIGSDLYTVGRTLAVLSFDFAGFTTRFADRLPEPAQIPLLSAEESYDRFLRRATHSDPARRFGSAAEMADQLAGVLREVLSAADGMPRPAVSGLFTGEWRTFGAGAPITGRDVALALPLPLVDPADPGAALLGTLDPKDPAAAIAALTAGAPSSIEVRLRLIRALLEAEDLAAARDELDRIATTTADWRIGWYTGLLALATGDAAGARTHFDLVFDLLPGEVAARLARAVAAELAGDRQGAAARYAQVWRVDHGYASAAFGLARMLAAGGDRAGAIAVLDEVPEQSSQHEPARIAAIRLAVDATVAPVGRDDLLAAGERLTALRLDRARHGTLAVMIFEAAIGWIAGGQAEPSAPRLLGKALTERELRFGLEAAYRMLAGLQPDTYERHALVDRANAVRPRTMV